MKATIKRAADSAQINLPPAALEALGNTDEVDVWVLGKGVVLLTETGALDKNAAGVTGATSGATLDASSKMRAGAGGRTAATAASDALLPSLSPDENSVIRKLLTIRFEERTVPHVAKKITTAEKKVLEQLVARRLIEVFKNAKYKEGVYNISQKVYSAVASPANFEADKYAPAGLSPDTEKRTVQSAPAPRISYQTAPAYSSSSSPQSSAKSLRPPINSAEHLAKFGYMVLNTEDEAKTVMVQIQPMLKNDDVRGIRGFDKRYYVLKRSFLHQYAGLVLAQLDSGPAVAEKIAAALNLDTDAVSVILMIMADEGEVIEKRKGMWERG